MYALFLLLKRAGAFHLRGVRTYIRRMCLASSIFKNDVTSLVAAAALDRLQLFRPRIYIPSLELGTTKKNTVRDSNRFDLPL